jgi:hypothetical protein
MNGVILSRGDAVVASPESKDPYPCDDAVNDIDNRQLATDNS